MTCQKQTQIERRREDFNYGWEPHFGEWKEGFVYRIKPRAKVKKWRWVFRYQTACDEELMITLQHLSDKQMSDSGTRLVFIQKIDSTVIEVDE